MNEMIREARAKLTDITAIRDQPVKSECERVKAERFFNMGVVAAQAAREAEVQDLVEALENVRQFNEGFCTGDPDDAADTMDRMIEEALALYQKQPCEEERDEQ